MAPRRDWGRGGGSGQGQDCDLCPVPTDTCYVLSFSIIMLNTSLHNPNVRDRPPFERFVSMNRGINDGSDLPEEQLRVRGVWPQLAPPPGVQEEPVLRSMAQEGLL